MIHSLRLATLLLATTIALPLSAQAADTYKLDPSHTAVVWHINHFGFSNPSGKFTNIDGAILLDEQNPAASKVNVVIPISSLVTGIPKLDEHLRTKDFFDIDQFPTASFVSDTVTVTDKKSATVQGMLTLHGVTKPVTLNVVLNQIGDNMFKKKTAGFSATTTIKRSDFGMTTYLPALGDDIKLDIESEANIATSDTK
jgi:polyisoprenoid-binding protein YceI